VYASACSWEQIASARSYRSTSCLTDLLKHLPRRLYGSDLRLRKVQDCARPKLQSSRHKNEIQYHLHATVAVPGGGGSIEQWGTAMNVGTNDSDNLLQYKPSAIV
jgi:hypothetical protein